MNERQQLEQAIAELEAQRPTLGDAVVDASIAALREKLSRLTTPAPTMEGERKLVTILFADISGFTELSEQLGPEQVRGIMNACFDRLVTVIERYEGTVDKFVGDAVMALFGAPTAHENDPERALRGALDIMAALEAFNAEQGTHLGLHIGVNTGLVIAGGIGPPGQQQYSVVGDAVNLAARLEDLSERGEILVGPNTYRLTAPLFVFQAREPIQIKGKADPVPLYRLQAIRPAPGNVRGVAGLTAPLVGRRREFETLQRAIARLEEGVGGIVTIVGEAGLGKSRLVAEARATGTADQSTQQPIRWVEGRARSYGSSIAYLLWLDALRALLNVSTESPAPAVRQHLRQTVERYGANDFDQIYPYLSRLLSLAPEEKSEQEIATLEGETLKKGTFQAVATLIHCITQDHPLILVCEDIHWADPTSIELLKHLLPLIKRVPLLLICPFRPKRESDCGQIREIAAAEYADRHTDIRLHPLSDQDSTTLVVHLLRLEGIPPQLKDSVLGHAEGNPLYVEEILRSLVDDGVIVRDQAHDRWEIAHEIEDIVIPDTLHGVLMARIDRLPETSKAILQTAAVIGRIFPYCVLAALTTETAGNGDREALDRHLLTLQQEEMIRERPGAPELAYIFKHHLTQEAAYNSLLKKERRLLHRQVAEALEQLFPKRLEEQVGLLAYHWERAGEPEKAATYLLRAGDYARIAYASEEAIDYYQRALAFLREQGEHGQAARTLMKLGLTYHAAFDFPQARRAYEEGFALWQRVGDMEPTTPPAPAPHPLRIAWSDPPTLDPTMAIDVYSSGVIDQLFSGLVELSPELDVVPAVARTWEVLENGRKYVFHLRDDVRWSDGTPVTAADFVYAWKRVLNPSVGSPTASLLYDVQGARAYHQGELTNANAVGVHALDDTTLIVDLEEPTAYFPQLLTYLPTYAVPRHVVAEQGEAWTTVDHIVTNGPFRLERWRRGQTIHLVRNPDYYGRFGGNVQRVELSLLANRSLQLQLYEDDQLDSLNLFVLSPAERNRARQRHAGEYIAGPLLGTSFLGFNVSRPPFDDARMRRALVLATDRELLANVILDGYEFPATGGYIPPGAPGHSAGIGLPYNPDQAHHFLAKAGYPLDRGGSVQAITSTAYASLSDHLASQWRKNLGVEIPWEVCEWTHFLRKLDREAPHIFLVGWLAPYPDPDNFLRISPAWRHTHWQDQTYAQLLDQARQITDQERRVALYRQADKRLVKQAIVIPLTYRRMNLLVKSWVKKYPTSGIKQWFWKDVIIGAN